MAASALSSGLLGRRADEELIARNHPRFLGNEQPPRVRETLSPKLIVRRNERIELFRLPCLYGVVRREKVIAPQIK